MPVKRRSYDCAPGCSVEATLNLIDGKWKGVILYHLLDGTIRFNELQRRLKSITQRMLVKQLRELEEVGLVARKIYAEVPPKVEYSLTDEGRSLEPILKMLASWGNDWIDRHTTAAGLAFGNIAISSAAVPA
ncbi:MAG: helix-turn-helix domain-containing protein [Ancalomicrobiaceae bacterium]|nr:helix-turn-helix domain-containing protein [Ancalomicrobiaceae bacterium]